MSIVVNADNFARAETDRMFQAMLADSGGVNKQAHNRVPTPLDHQPVIRQNRDTLYSASVVDISQGATLTIPDSGGRYLSVMPINQDGYVNAVYYDPGEYELTTGQFGTGYLMLPVRILINPADPGDVAQANALQDQVTIQAAASRPFTVPDYDPASFDATRQALLQLAQGLPGFERAFGAREQVDPVRHLIGCAAAWGGLPDTEAQYLNVHPGLPPGEYQITVGEVPVDGFWSVSLYNAEGYFPQDAGGKVSVNNLTAARDPDGSITIRFGGSSDHPNYLPTMEGWNYLVRLYRPRPEILNGTWTFPAVTPVR
jgi:hypothetical protein